MALAPSITISLPGYPFENFPSVETVAELRAVISILLADGANYVVDGGTSAGDGLGGVYAWNDASVEADDGVKVIRPTDTSPGQAGRWILTANATYETDIAEAITLLATLLASASGGAQIGFLQSGTGAVLRTMLAKTRETSVSVDDFGAQGVLSGAPTVNDASAFVLAIAEAAARGGGVVRYYKRHLINNNITIPRGVTIEGPQARADPGNPFADRTGFFASLPTVPALILNPAATITHQGAGGFDKVYIFRKGLVLDGTDLATSYTGTAITTGASDAVFIRDCSILGFQNAAAQGGTARVTWDSVLIDCNNGIRQETSYDENTYKDVHCYGVLQSGLTVNDPRTIRVGTAFYLGGTFNGGPSLDSCFEYGFTIGFDFVCPGSYKFIGCWSDGPTDATTKQPLDSTSIGVRFLSIDPANLNAEPQFIGLTISAKGSGMQIGSPASTEVYGAVLAIGAHIYQCNVGINCWAKKLVLVGAAVRSYFVTGIIFNSKAAADSAKLIGLELYGRQVGSTSDINCGGGHPIMVGCTYDSSSTLNIINLVPISAARNGAGLVTIPDGRDLVRITGTGVIGDIQPRTPGRRCTFVFAQTGLSIANGANFKTVGAVTLSGAIETSITMRVSPDGLAWREECRAIF